MAIPGVGLPIPASLPENWRSNWCPQLKPPGGEFTPPAEAVAAQWPWREACPSRGWIGGFGEAWQQRTTEALRLAWEIDLWGTKSQYDGNYTVREFEYAVVYVPKTDDMFIEWWIRQEGGSFENPFVFNDSNAAANAQIINAAKAEEAWPDFGEVGSFTGWSAAPNGWRVYVKNMVVNEGEEPPVEPPTPPPPPPEPEPPVPPDADNPEAAELERVMVVLETSGWRGRDSEAPSVGLALLLDSLEDEVTALSMKLANAPEPPSPISPFLSQATDETIYAVLANAENATMLFGQRKENVLRRLRGVIEGRDRRAAELRNVSGVLLAWIARYEKWRAL